MQQVPTNLDDFLKDIPGENPVGVFLRYSQDYDDIRESLREEADLPQGVWVRDIKVGDWQTASTLCQDVLITKSKDLQVAAWLIESWMFLYGVPGFTQGINLMYALSQRYWDIIYPEIKEEDLDYRLAPFHWLNEKLSNRMNRLLVTSPTNQDLRSYPFFSWIEVSRLQGLVPMGDRQQSDAPLGQIGTRKNPTLLDFNTSLDNTDISFYQNLQNDIKISLNSIQSFSIFLDQKLGKSAPTLYRLKNQLNDLLKFTTQTISEKEKKAYQSPPPNDEIFKDEKLQESASEGITSPVENENTASSNAESISSGMMNQITTEAIHDRDQAYAMVDSAINYLKTHDPHSPIPYLIEKISSWRSMNFMDIMKHLTDDQKTNFLKILKDAYGKK